MNRFQNQIICISCLAISTLNKAYSLKITGRLAASYGNCNICSAFGKFLLRMNKIVDFQKAEVTYIQ